MPRRDDIHKILILGSGPIVIGQAAEFDYSGVQACKVLREEGYEIVLVNSNPATIMTDPEFADRTYIEPMTVDVLERIIAAEKPDALLPTIGGQTGLNLALDLAAAGVLEKHGVELIGAKVDAIKRAEDRDLFKATMASIGLDLPRSGIAHSFADAERIRATIGLPLIIRPSRTLGGTGGSFATTDAEFTCKSRSVARVQAGAQKEPVYRYLFTHVLENDPQLKALGSAHTVEHLFLCGWRGTYRPSDVDRAVQKQLVGYWTRLAKTGNPNGGADPEWPAISGDGEAYLEIGADTGARRGPADAHCDFWDATPLLWPHL